MTDLDEFDRLKLAEAMLVDAQVSLKNMRYRSAISRAYYACYHSASACLEKAGIAITSRSEHEACVRLFGKHLVLTGIFPSWMGERLNVLKRARERADYKWNFPHLDRLANELVPKASYFLEEVKRKWDNV